MTSGPGQCPQPGSTRIVGKQGPHRRNPAWPSTTDTWRSDVGRRQQGPERGKDRTQVDQIRKPVRALSAVFTHPEGRTQKAEMPERQDRCQRRLLELQKLSMGWIREC